MISEDTVYIDADPASSKVNYHVQRPNGGWRRVFPPEYIDILRPIAETLAMLDGNAFFGEDWRSWINYLPEADAVYRANSSPRDVSWLSHYHHNDPTLKDAWDKYQTLLSLKRQK